MMISRFPGVAQRWGWGLTHPCWCCLVPARHWRSYMGTWLHLLRLAKFSACLNRNLTKWAGLVLAKKGRFAKPRCGSILLKADGSSPSTVALLRLGENQYPSTLTQASGPKSGELRMCRWAGFQAASVLSAADSFPAGDTQPTKIWVIFFCL